VGNSKLPDTTREIVLKSGYFGSYVNAVRESGLNYDALVKQKLRKLSAA
jgi:topoisomerase IA-like protein